ncbi:MAG: hypothetical protein MK132_13990 [Lentisphaerales bacterium]|nr:hypothetical protein [Lentisphaerales bacterium]
MPLLKGERPAEWEMLFELHSATALRVGDWKDLKVKGESAQLFNLKEDSHWTRNLVHQQQSTFTRLESSHNELLRDIASD